MRKRMLLRRVRIIVAAVVVVLTTCLSSYAVYGSELSDVEHPDELLLGVFTQSRLDSTDMLYVSRDGVHMEFVGSAFRDSTPEYDSVDESGRESVDGQFTLVNPSIIWHGGRFWLLATTIIVMSITSFVLSHRAARICEAGRNRRLSAFP